MATHQTLDLGFLVRVQAGQPTIDLSTYEVALGGSEFTLSEPKCRTEFILVQGGCIRIGIKKHFAFSIVIGT